MKYLFSVPDSLSTNNFCWNNAPGGSTEIQAALETQKEEASPALDGGKIDKFLTGAKGKLKTESFEKLQSSVLASLKNTVSPDFPLVSLGSFNRDAETGIDGTEFNEYLQYLDQMLSGIETMPELHENYSSTEEKRKAYELLTKYDTEEPKAVAELVKSGVEIAKIEARIGLWKALSSTALGTMNEDLKGSWYQNTASFREEAIKKLEDIKLHIFDSSFTGQASFQCSFEKWDGPGDPNFGQTETDYITEEEFLQRILVYSSVSGTEISEAFSTTPSLGKQKTVLEEKIGNTPDGETPDASSVESLQRIEKAERLEKFLDAIEKSSAMEKEGFSNLGTARDNLRRAGTDEGAFNIALASVSTVLKDYSEYYESSDNFWDWGWANDAYRVAAAGGSFGLTEAFGIGAAMNEFENFGQGDASWITESDANLAIALRSVGATEESATIMRQEMQHLQAIQLKKDGGTELNESEQALLEKHEEELPTIKTIAQKAEQYKNSPEGKQKATQRYESLLTSLRGSGDLPPEYLQLLSAGREKSIEGIASKMAFQKSTDEYIEQNGIDSLDGSTILSQYDDMKGLNGFWNWSDENVEMGKEIAKMIVVIIITEVATMGLATGAVYAEAAVMGASIARAGMSAAKVARLAKVAQKGARVFELAQKGSQATKGARILAKGAKTLLSPMAKLSKANARAVALMHKSGKLGKFGQEVLSGAAKFTAVESALFGVEAPDKLFAKFAQNVEMFALFGGAGKIAGKVTGKIGRKVTVEGGKKIITSLATKTGVGPWLAQQGIALTSEFGTFATFQAVETGLMHGEISLNKDELIHLMAFSTMMRFTHGFPNIAKTIGKAPASKTPTNVQLRKSYEKKVAAEKKVFNEKKAKNLKNIEGKNKKNAEALKKQQAKEPELIIERNNLKKEVTNSLKKNVDAMKKGDRLLSENGEPIVIEAPGKRAKSYTLSGRENVQIKIKGKVKTADILLYGDGVCRLKIRGSETYIPIKGKNGEPLIPKRVSESYTKVLKDLAAIEGLKTKVSDGKAEFSKEMERPFETPKKTPAEMTKKELKSEIEATEKKISDEAKHEGKSASQERLETLNGELNTRKTNSVINTLKAVPQSIKGMFEGIKGRLKNLRPREATVKAAAEIKAFRPNLPAGQAWKIAAALVVGMFIPQLVNSTSSGEAPGDEETSDLSAADRQEIEDLLSEIEDTTPVATPVAEEAPAAVITPPKEDPVVVAPLAPRAPVATKKGALPSSQSEPKIELEKRNTLPVAEMKEDPVYDALAKEISEMTNRAKIVRKLSPESLKKMAGDALSFTDKKGRVWFAEISDDKISRRDVKKDLDEDERRRNFHSKKVDGKYYTVYRIKDKSKK